ncbi:MAG: triose-phosphate isomerase [Anaerolineales bacterium]
MRIPLVAGNWKMNNKIDKTRQLVMDLVPGLQSISDVENVICPPFTALKTAADLLKNTEIGLGAQNMHWEDAGAFTGEVSPPMIAELCNWVILGHSERRQYFGEDDQTVNKKVKAALSYNLTPIVCIGETLEENEAQRTKEVVSRQLRGGLADIDLKLGMRFVIAYEPIWAIGTGKSATPTDANLVHGEVIRPIICELFGEDVGLNTRVLYGGSVKPKNAKDFFNQPEIDGALVGGASLNASDFVAITRSAA